MRTSEDAIRGRNLVDTWAVDKMRQKNTGGRLGGSSKQWRLFNLGRTVPHVNGSETRLDRPIVNSVSSDSFSRAFPFARA